jgi:hypothetical protein
MLDLDEIKLPKFVVQLGGKPREFDPIILAYKLQDLEGADPTVITDRVGKLFGSSVTSLQAFKFLAEFKTFADACNLAEILKNVLGSELSLDTTTESPTPLPAA